jgi:hypothetical protein
MGNSLNFQHPLFSADRRLNDLILDLFLVVTMISATSELGKILNIIIRLLSILNHISDIGVSFHIIIVVSVVIHVALATVVLNNWLLELEFVLKADLAESCDERAHSLSIA